MKRFSSAIVLFGSSLLLGSPIESTPPLAPSANAPLDSRLTGLWRVPPEDVDGEEISSLVMPFNEHEYYIELHSGHGDGIVRFRAFITVIGRARFLNVVDLDDLDGGFMICRYWISTDDELTVRFLDEKFLNSETDPPTDMLTRVEQNLSNPDLYGGDPLTLEKDGNR